MKRLGWIAGGLIGVAAISIGVADAVAPARLTSWSTQFGSSVADRAAAVIVAPNGYIYVYGQTEGDLGGAPENTDPDVFVACYDKTGKFKWMRQFGTEGVETPGNQIGVARNGDLYVTGTTDGEFPAEFLEGGQDVFVAKLSKKGELRWVRQIGGTGNDRGWGITRAPSGDLYLTGETTSTDLDGGSLPTPTPSGAIDGFLMKLDRNGAVRWSTQFGSPEDDWPWGVAVSRKGEIYVSGTTRGDIDGEGTEEFHGSDNTTGDGFVSRYDNRGNLVWTRQVGGSADDQLYGVATDSFGDVYVNGFTYGSLGTNDGFVDNLGGSDGVLMKFSKSGELRWTHQHGTAGDDFEWTMTIHKSNKIVVGGYTTGSLGEFTNVGGTDAYVIRFDTSGTLVGKRQFGTPTNDSTETWGTPVAFTPWAQLAIFGTTSGATWGQPHFGSEDVFLTTMGAP